MFKNDAINYFGSKAKLATAAGVSRASVSAWGDLVPEGRASRLVLASGGHLAYDPKTYDAHRKAKRTGKLKHENHTDG
ncbi:Cro/CI family transcriptional regulator [Enterobacter asburiae]|uniref:Cro/CI family transcriptional regulator n=1 Tax=Enterobacter asburiae TaxID=61645 RepID=UPI000940F9F3|nr:Cro/CI family transcriptional regulator [Enterobacter asburiae]